MLRRLLLALPVLLGSCASLAAPSPMESAESAAWHVRAVQPEGRLLDVVARDVQGGLHPVVARATPGNLHVLELATDVAGTWWPVVVPESDDPRPGLRAVGVGGAVLPVFTLDEENALHEVRAVRRSGNVLHVKAVAPDGALWGVKAVSPAGLLDDVKGLKTSRGPVDVRLAGVPVDARVAALPQVVEPGGDVTWHVRGLHPSGHALDVVALAPDGRELPVEALETPGNLHLLDVKARDGARVLPIKVLETDGASAPLVAIAPGPTLLDVVARTADGARYEVRAVRRAGNLLHVKVVAPGGELWGVKALSPAGQLHDVKGVVLAGSGPELVVEGVRIRAHVKALPQTGAD